MSSIAKIIGRLKNGLDPHSLEVIHKSCASLIVKVLGMIMGLLVSLTLGKELGAQGIGIINLANRSVSILLILAMFGMEKVILKEIAIGVSKGDWNLVGSTIATGIRFNVLLSILLICITLFITPLLITNFFNEPELKIPFIIAIIAMLPQVISRIYGAGLIGYRKIWQSNLVNETLSVWVVGILIYIYLIIGITLNVVHVAWFYAIGRLIVSLTMLLYWRKIGPSKFTFTLRIKSMLKVAMPLLLVNATTILASNVDIIMLGWLSDVKSVGLYSVASRLALLTSFFLQISNSAISPKLASLNVQNKKSEMQLMIKQVIRGLIAIGFLSVIFFVFTGEWVLSLWGDEFIVAYSILIVLVIGQFINISTGPVGMLLIMCGEEKFYGRVASLFLLINIALNFIFITQFGVIGAAYATALTVIGDNIVKVIFVKRRLGVKIL